MATVITYTLFQQFFLTPLEVSRVILTEGIAKKKEMTVKSIYYIEWNLVGLVIP